ncbi:lysosomal-associated transmembrane protein 4A-like [Drosophila miranda]|uniref:lysosomal-associated transmembrane protein 4A-like n=1 Tax=Drosophila miranda TaxID=7229 RepID=UPI00143F6C89|nr:lysosomal-associated transmembrane protein 4A-like [Drosophila miranda]
MASTHTIYLITHPRGRVLAVIWRNPEMMDELESGSIDYTVDLNAPALPTPLSKVFDFAITTLTAAGYLCYLQAIHRIIAESHRLHWREKLLELPPEELVVVVLVVFVCIVFLKAYCIGIVWRCYKYLTLRQQHIRTLFPFLETGSGINGVGSTFGAEERAYTTLLPNYDEAIAQYLKQAPPPSYQVAMSNYQEDQAGEAGGAEANPGVPPLFVALLHYG